MVDAFQHIRTGGDRLAPLIETIPGLGILPLRAGVAANDSAHQMALLIEEAQRHLAVFRQAVGDWRSTRLRRLIVRLLRPKELPRRRNPQAARNENDDSERPDERNQWPPSDGTPPPAGQPTDYSEVRNQPGGLRSLAEPGPARAHVNRLSGFRGGCGG